MEWLFLIPDLIQLIKSEVPSFPGIVSLIFEKNEQQKKSASPRTLRNDGFYCYVNSLIQCLFCSESFQKLILETHSNEISWPLFDKLHNLFLKMRKSGKDPIKSSFQREIHQNLYGRRGDQGDPSELLLVLLRFIRKEEILVINVYFFGVKLNVFRKKK